MNMKRLAHTLTFLLVLGLTGSLTEAHKRRHPRPRMAGGSVIQEIDAGTPEEKARIVEACEVHGRPKPEGDIRVVSPFCGKAISKPRPPFPEEAKEARASGQVRVDVVTDERGRVVWAKAATGHPLLQGVSQKAACRARYSPTLISGRPVKTETSITYNFVLR